jgi:hypothetical protein
LWVILRLIFELLVKLLMSLMWGVFSDTPPQAAPRSQATEPILTINIDPKTAARFRRFWAALALACLPGLMTLILLGVFFGAGPGDFMMTIVSDQANYWHTSGTFKEAGLGGGYYGFNEEVGRLPWLRFDIKGPLLSIVYGSLGHLIGWDLETAIWANLILFGGGVFLLVYAARMDGRQRIALGVVLASFWLVPFFLPSFFIESLNHLMALLLALAMYRLGRGPLTWRGFALAWALIFLASQARIAWALLYPALFWLQWRPESWRAWLGGGAMGGASLIVAVGFFQWTVPPGSNSVFYALEAANSNPLSAIEVYAGIAGDNLAAMLSTPPLSLEGLLYMQVLGLILGLPLWAAWQGWRGEGLPKQAWEGALHWYNLTGILAASLIVYLPAGYWRVLGAHLLFSLALMILWRQWRVLGLVLVLNALLVFDFQSAYEAAYRADYTSDSRGLLADRALMASQIAYDPAAADPWCNTLLMPAGNADARVLMIPFGLGIQNFNIQSVAQLASPLRSRYVWVDTQGFDLLNRHQAQLELRLLAYFRTGNLYENRLAACPPLDRGPLLVYGTGFERWQQSLPGWLPPYRAFIAGPDWPPGPEAILFNPVTNQGYAHRWAAAQAQAQSREGLARLAALEQMRYQEELSLDAGARAQVQAWRNSRQPEALCAAGLPYLILDATWISYLTDSEWALFNDPTRYAFVMDIPGPDGGGGYQIYRAVCP